MSNPPTNICYAPLVGRRCTREAGHTGPCAGVPDYAAPCVTPMELATLQHEVDLLRVVAQASARLLDAQALYNAVVEAIDLDDSRQRDLAQTAALDSDVCDAHAKLTGALDMVGLDRRAAVLADASRIVERVKASTR